MFWIRSDKRLDALARFSSRQSSQFDSESFAKIYDAHVDKIYKYIYYKVGTAVEAEDLTAQVFLNAWQALGRYRQTDRPVSAWLFRIAHNLVIDHFRTQHATVPIDGLPFLSYDDDVEELAQQHLTADMLRQAMQQLTDDQRDVILLKFLDGYSTAEVATILSRDQAAVRALQRRALIALHRILKNNAEFIGQMPRA
jgi:RNA polymerase sigma-70 factor, ECF subfamily